MILALALTLVTWGPYPAAPGVEIVVQGAVYQPVWTTCYEEDGTPYRCPERYDVYPFPEVSVPSSESAAPVWHEALTEGSVLAFRVWARRGECWST